MKITATSSLREIAFLVCTALEKDGLTAVLSGGGAATIWAPMAVQSDDLDFILTLRSREQSDALMDLGYELDNGLYIHPENQFRIEFPPGPLAVGREILTEWETLREGEFLLHVIRPTDSCRDRLSAFLHWNDYGALNQAVAVAKQQIAAVDLNRIREWCEIEGKTDKYRMFAKLL